MELLSKLAEFEQEFERVQQELTEASAQGNIKVLQEAGRRRSTLEPLVDYARRYRGLLTDLAEAQRLAEDEDPEMRQLAAAERDQFQGELDQLERDIADLLRPKDPRDDKNVIIEIRAGAGGEEAGLFASELFRMYTRYAEGKGWKAEELSSHPTGIGGFKEVIFGIQGKGAYSRFRHESGVHRVQRVPVTEAGGRIHTSTVTVAVLAEAEEVELVVPELDLRVDTFCSSGPGGQGVNTTYSAVRITHLPTGTIVSCQDERSQIKNKARAMRILRSRLLDRMEQEQHAKERDARRKQVGSGERSEKIRTYNFPQSRITDHRINFSVHNLPAVMEGDLDTLVEALDQASRQAEEPAKV